MAGRQPRDWIHVSVNTLQLMVTTTILLAVGGVSFWAYKMWADRTVEQRAYEAIDKSISLMQRLEKEKELDSYRTRYESAAEVLKKAQSALAEEQFEAAHTHGKDCLRFLQGIQKSIKEQGQGRVGSFNHVQGTVEYRRGEKGDFRLAHPRAVLYEGDWVRSSSQGSAEIYFDAEGTLFTLGPNALFKLNRRRVFGGKAKSLGVMEYGWVSLNTAQQTSAVTTKFADFRVEGNSQATVALPENSSQGQFVVNRGRAEVKSVKTGEIRQLAERELVMQKQGRLGNTTALPARPELTDPPDNYTIDIERTEQVKLSWSPVEGAVRYALQVSRERMFVDNEIDVENRATTTANLGIQDEGNFFWRVAAFGPTGLRGDWSKPERKFRVASFGGIDVEVDKTPPELELEVLANGHIVIIQGRTEPGAKLEMNGDPISVKADGTFRTSKGLQGQGVTQLVFRAVDEAGNAAVETRQIYLESL